MKKETLIAIFFGIFFGAILAVLLLIKNKQLEFNKTKTIAPTIGQTQTAKTMTVVEQPIEISQPQDGQIVNNNSITIKGKAETGALIVIESANYDIIFKNSKTEFSTNVPLSFGENNFLITVYPKDPQTRSLEKGLKVYYLDEQL